MSGSHYIILNGKVLSEELALVSPANRGLMYGDGCFETLRAYEGEFLRWAAHYDRLTASCNYLDIDIPFSSSELHDYVYKLLKRNDQSEEQAIVRIQCWRNGGRGYANSNRGTSWFIQSTSYDSIERSMKLHLAESRCIPSEALDRRYKLSNGLNYIKAAREAQDADCDDALMLTTKEKISETTTANLFWITDGQIFTPSENCDLLPGITRSIIIELCKKHDVDMQEGEFEMSHLRQAEAVFCTNSVIEMRQIQQIGNQTYQENHSLYKQLEDGFKKLKSLELKS